VQVKGGRTTEIITAHLQAMTDYYELGLERECTGSGFDQFNASVSCLPHQEEINGIVLKINLLTLNIINFPYLPGTPGTSGSPGSPGTAGSPGTPGYPGGYPDGYPGKLVHIIVTSRQDNNKEQAHTRNKRDERA
jgi:hypothetical protein